MKIYQLAQTENDIILPAGTKLYHGTGEDFDKNEVRTGGYDGVFWTCDTPIIAKTYIPVSGGQLLATSDSIAQPTTQPSVITIQKAIGIDYDQSSFEMSGPQVRSWKIPPVKVSKLASNSCLKAIADIDFLAASISLSEI